MYISEAHPNEAKNRFPIDQPKTLEERQKVAKEFAAAVKLTPPVLVDAIDNVVNDAYAGWPDRVYIIDKDGKLALKGGLGPAGFAPAVKAASATLDKLLGGK